jgi:hypothetical protein
MIRSNEETSADKHKLEEGLVSENSDSDEEMSADGRELEEDSVSENSVNEETSAVSIVWLRLTSDRIVET